VKEERAARLRDLKAAKKKDPAAEQD